MHSCLHEIWSYQYNAVIRRNRGRDLEEGVI